MLRSGADHELEPPDGARPRPRELRQPVVEDREQDDRDGDEAQDRERAADGVADALGPDDLQRLDAHALDAVVVTALEQGVEPPEPDPHQQQRDERHDDGHARPKRRVAQARRLALGAVARDRLADGAGPDAGRRVEVDVERRGVRLGEDHDRARPGDDATRFGAGLGADRRRIDGRVCGDRLEPLGHLRRAFRGGERRRDARQPEHRTAVEGHPGGFEPRVGLPGRLERRSGGSRGRQPRVTEGTGKRGRAQPACVRSLLHGVGNVGKGAGRRTTILRPAGCQGRSFQPRARIRSVSAASASANAPTMARLASGAVSARPKKP